MVDITIIGVDLAKNLLQVHGAVADGSALSPKTLPPSWFAELAASRA